MHIALVISLFLTCATTSHSFILRLASTERRCVFDELKVDSLATGFYSAGKDSNLKLTVTGPDGSEIFSTDNANEGKFAFAAKETGKYTTCVQNADLVPREIELKLKSGVEAKDLSEVAQRDHLMPLAVELLRLQQIAEEIRSEMKYLFQTETDMRQVNEETNSRVRFFTLFSLFVIFTLGTWQVIYVRGYLTSKKVL